MHLGIFALLLLPLCFSVQLEWVAAGVGVNFGTSVGPQSAEGLVQLLRSRGIGKIRLHDADSAILRAIATGSRGAPINVIVGVTNDEIVDIGASPALAQSWIARNVVPYLPATNIIAIAVGSEVLTSRQADHSTVVSFLVPAMRNLYAALSEVGLEKQIKVSAPQSGRALSTYFPPSSSTFNGDMDRAVGPLLDFLASSGSYFMLNLYPQDLQHDGAVGLNKQQLPAEHFAASGEMVDPQTGRHYSSMVDVLTDAVSMAMASVGHHHKPSVVGIEMEWSPTSASNLLRTERTSGGVAVDIDPRFSEEIVMNLPQVEKKSVKAAAFSSRRFLVDHVQAKQADESGKRRRLADKSWCVAKPDADTNALQGALDWACGPIGNADCTLIQVGQSCFLPNTIVSHASYAFNNYYQKQSWSAGSCDFGGLAQTTTSDPSSASCLYISSTSANGTPSTPTGTTVPNGTASSRLSWERCRFIFTSFIFMFLIKRTLPDFKI